MDVAIGDYVLTRVKSLHSEITVNCPHFELSQHYNIANQSILEEFRSYQKNLCRSSMKLINRVAFKVITLDRVHHVCKYGLTVDDNDEDLFFGDPSKGVYIDLHIEHLLKHSQSDYVIVAVCKIFWWLKGHSYVYSYDMCPKLPPKELFAIHRCQKWPSKIYMYQYSAGKYLQSPHNILPHQFLVYRRTGSAVSPPDLRLLRPVGETNGDRHVDRPHPRLRVQLVDLDHFFSFEEMTDFWITDQCFQNRLEKLDSFRHRYPTHLARQFRIVKGSEPAPSKRVSAETSRHSTKNGRKIHVDLTAGKRGSRREEAKQMNGHVTGAFKVAPVATPKMVPVIAPKEAPVAAPKVVPVVASKVVPAIASKEAPVATPKVVPVIAPKEASVAAPKMVSVVAPKRKRRWDSNGIDEPHMNELVREATPPPAVVHDELKISLTIPPCDPPRIPSPPPAEATVVSKVKKRKKIHVPPVASTTAWPPMIPLEVEAKPVTHPQLDARLWRLISRLTYEEQSYITDPRINRHLLYYVERDRAEKYQRKRVDSKPCSTSGIAFASHLVREFDSFNDATAVQSQEVCIPTQDTILPLCLPLAVPALRTPSPVQPAESPQSRTVEDRSMSTVGMEAHTLVDGTGFNQVYAINGKCGETRSACSATTRESPHSPPFGEWQLSKSSENPLPSERICRSTNGGKRPKLDIGDTVPANLLPYYVRRNSYVVWRPISDEEYTQLRSQRPSRFNDDENFTYLDRVASFAADKKPYLRDLAEEEIQKLYHQRIALAKERDFREKEFHLKSIDDLVKKYKDLIQKNC